MPAEPVLQALSDNISKGNYKKALTFCDKKLVLEAENKAVIKTKCLCYIQLGEEQAGLDFINSLKPALQEDLQEEKVYCLYKLRKHDQVLDIVRKTEKPSITLRHLEGQTLYRLGEYKKAHEVFRSIQKESDTPEILVNLAATTSMGRFADDELQQVQSTNKSSFELAFNNACSLINNNQLRGAEQQLELALSK